MTLLYLSQFRAYRDLLRLVGGGDFVGPCKWWQMIFAVAFGIVTRAVVWLSVAGFIRGPCSIVRVCMPMAFKGVMGL